jgi:hypothetical protein
MGLACISCTVSNGGIPCTISTAQDRVWKPGAWAQETALEQRAAKAEALRWKAQLERLDGDK